MAHLPDIVVQLLLCHDARLHAPVALLGVADGDEAGLHGAEEVTADALVELRLDPVLTQVRADGAQYHLHTTTQPIFI